MKVALAHAHVFRLARGIERYTVNVASALAAAGVDTSIVTLRQPPPAPHGTRGVPAALRTPRYPELDARVRVRTLPNPRYYTALTTIPLYLADFARARYDHVVLAFALNGEGVAARVASALPCSRTRYSIVFHFPYEASPARFREFQRYGLLEHAAHRIAVSRYIADSVYAHLGVTCTVIPEGVDLDQFRPDAGLRDASRRALGIAPGERVVITVAALEPRKGVDRLLRALAPGAGGAPADRVVVVGEGPQSGSLRAQATTLGLAERVVWIDRAADLPALYNAADLFALLSDHEAFGLAALEAMACGRPVVVSVGSAFSEFVVPGTGLLVDPADPAAVRAALGGLLRDDTRRSRMGQAARTHVVTAGYGWDHVAARLRALLSTPGRPAASRLPYTRASGMEAAADGIDWVAHMPPTLSVLIATYNRADLLDRTLRSLCAGVTEQPDEIVVVSGGHDRSAEVVRTYTAAGAPVRLVEVVNVGLSNSQNVGLAQCHGDIVATLDDDVIVAPDWARQVRRAHAAHPTAGGIGGRTLNEFPGALAARFEQARSFDVPAGGGRAAAGGDGARAVRTVAGVNMSYKRGAMERVGSFDESLPAGMDVDYNWRMAHAGFQVLHDPSIVLTHHNRTSAWRVLRQQFWYGRGFLRTRHKWPDLPSRPPRGLRGWKNWVKIGLFVVDPLYQAWLFARRAPVPGDRLTFAALACAGDLVWKAGFLYEALHVSVNRRRRFGRLNQS